MYTYINGSDTNSFMSLFNGNFGAANNYQAGLLGKSVGTFTYNAVSVGLSYHFG